MYSWVTVEVVRCWQTAWHPQWRHQLKAILALQRSEHGYSHCMVYLLMLCLDKWMTIKLLHITTMQFQWEHINGSLSLFLQTVHQKQSNLIKTNTIPIDLLSVYGLKGLHQLVPCRSECSFWFMFVLFVFLNDLFDPPISARGGWWECIPSTLLAYCTGDE